MFYVRDEGQSGPDGLFSTTPMTTKTVKGENKEEQEQETPTDRAAMDPADMP